MQEHDTIHSLPLPKRPETGLQAWLATIGYISAEYSPDATLTLRANLFNNLIVWSGVLKWGQNEEAVQGMSSLPTALRELWKTVERNHVIFKSLEAATRRPANYREENWLDADTASTLDRLLSTTRAACASNWRLMIMYQAVGNPDLRVQARLLTKDKQLGGRGPTIPDACRELYRNAAPTFASWGQPFDTFFADH